MNALFVLIFTCGGALAIGRGLDLALWTDWNTGLCTAGSVWLLSLIHISEPTRH